MDLSKFDEMGLSFNKPSLQQVELPHDITMLNSEQLAEKFTALTAWADYIASEHAMAIIAERNALKERDFLENTLLISKMGAAARGERITLVKAQIAIDPTVRALDKDYEEKYAYRKLVEVALNNHERDLSLVSREITRRGNDSRALRKEYGI